MINPDEFEKLIEETGRRATEMEALARTTHELVEESKRRKAHLHALATEYLTRRGRAKDGRERVNSPRTLF